MTPHPTPWRSILILSSQLRLGLPSNLIPSGFPTKTLYTPLPFLIRATCPAHHILLDFIARTIVDEEYRSWIVNQSRISQTQHLYYIKMCVKVGLHVSALQEAGHHQASIAYVFDLIVLFSNGWPDDGLLQGRNL
jgi:hypothetical protein